MHPKSSYLALHGCLPFVLSKLSRLSHNAFRVFKPLQDRAYAYDDSGFDFESLRYNSNGKWDNDARIGFHAYHQIEWGDIPDVVMECLHDELIKEFLDAS